MIDRFGQLAKLFLKLGGISFGGPAAHIAIMEDEVVQRRGWLARQEFLDLIGATHLIPGPNAVEMAAHVGYRRAGFAGSLIAGASFTLPAVLLSLGLAWGYVRFGAIPQVEPLLAGIKPAVLAVILAAVVRLGRKALDRWQTALIGMGVAAAVIVGSDEVAALLVGTLIGVLLLCRPASRPTSGKANSAGILSGLAVFGLARPAKAASLVPMLAGAGAAAGSSVPLWKLALFFLKVAAVMYGGGYVLVAYLEGDLVGDYRWLTQQELLDAVAIGQITPGPMLSTATFVGYLVAGIPGAVVATLGMLVPCFLFVAMANPIVPRIRKSPWSSRFLDAVNAASIGLMVAVTVKLSYTTLGDPAGPLAVNWRGCLIAAAAAVVATRWKVAPGWIVLGGAAAGLLLFPASA
jgi:chromate transporter